MSKCTRDTHLDDILEKYDLFGRYHVFIYTFLSIAFIFNSMYSVHFIFITEDSPYRCKIKECETENSVWSYFNSSILESNKCYRHELISNSTCTYYNFSATLIPCNEWVYEDPTSFVAEFQLACQDWKRTFIGTIHMIGLMCGLLIMGPISDRLGRKMTVVFTATMGGVFGLLKSFVTSYWLYVLCEFLGTCIGDLCSSCFTLSIEIVSKDKRIHYQTLGGLAYAFGGVILAGIAYAIPYWRYYLRAIYTPSLLFITYYFIIDESSRWLLSKGRKDEAVKIIEKSARINRITIEKDLLDNLMSDDEPDKLTFKHVLISTMKSKILLKRLLVCMFWWITITFCSYGFTINAVSLDGNKYLNFTWTYVVEIPATILLMYMLIHFKRKRPLVAAFIFGGVICLSQPFLPAEMKWLSITFYLIGKFTSSYTFSGIYIFTSELFPTYTRNSMHALCSAVGRIGSMFAPQTPLLLKYWSGLPTLLFGLMSTIAGLLTLLMPDPADDALPDTVLQAERVGATDERTTKL